MNQKTPWQIQIYRASGMRPIVYDLFSSVEVSLAASLGLASPVCSPSAPLFFMYSS